MGAPRYVCAGALARIEADAARIRELEEALRKIAGYDGRFNSPFPEGHPDYPAFAIVTAREALSTREEGKT